MSSSSQASWTRTVAAWRQTPAGPAGSVWAGSGEGCALKAHGVQSPEMVAAVKLSWQPRTESCVVAGTALRSVDREAVDRNISERKIAPKSIVIEVADPIPLRGRQNLWMRHSECPEMLPGFVPPACNQRTSWEQGRAVRCK